MDKPKRRPRYKGTHPRKFQEKYKELNPELYPEEIQKAKQAGKTPAGSHRPICLNEILKILSPKPGQIIIDATLGYGGHTVEILKKITPGGKLLGFDLDTTELPKTEARIRALGFGADSFIACQENFARIPKALSELKIQKAHGLVADLGISSMQLDNPDRGFSFKNEGPLDLRLNPQSKMTAAELLNTVGKFALIKILKDNADEDFAEIIAQAIINQQKNELIETTQALTATVQRALQTLPLRVQKEVGNRPVRRVFQALRIAVNNEFQSLDNFLNILPTVLRAGGKAAILTFHSGEDRRVKKAFQAGHREGVYLDVSKDVIRPTDEEVYTNPRASSAKLRWAIKS